MTTIAKPRHVIIDLADFFAAGPTAEEILEYRPPKATQRRLSKLLAKQQAGKTLTTEESDEIDSSMQVESFMSLLKAKLHAKKAKPP